jgi:hypothetical protein
MTTLIEMGGDIERLNEREEGGETVADLPSAQAAATASTGYSSIIAGARSGGTATPFRRLWSRAPRW